MTTPQKTGRKPIDIDPEQVEKLAAMHCTNREIAAFFNCSVDTIERRFAAILTKGRDMGRIKLRRLQWQSCEKGNVVMQLFLGKNLLGQSDRVEQVHSGDIEVLDRARSIQAMPIKEQIRMMKEQLTRLQGLENASQ